MRVTQQLRYSLCGVFDLAYHRDDRPTRIEEIGRRQGIPTRYLEQIFQKLRRAGLVISKRGPGGGYLLARPPEQISLADVMLAIQPPVVTTTEASSHPSETQLASETQTGSETPRPSEAPPACASSKGQGESSAPGKPPSTRAGCGEDPCAGSLAFVSEVVEQRILTALKAETIAGLCREATRQGVPRTPAAPLMYEI